jgi:hypothetical protein
LNHPTKEEFLERMKDHTLTVFHDDGLYRHIRMSKGNSWIDQFDLVTWPGHLSYSGDLGDFTFQRLDDMFKFFRGHEEPNPYYWSGKLQSVDKHGGYEEYSDERLFKQIEEDFKYWDFDNSEQKKGAWKDIEEELMCGFDNMIDAKSALDQYASPFGGHEFVDAWEWDLTDWTYRFMLACYGIPWAISKYDEYKLAQAHASHP